MTTSARKCLLPLLFLASVSGATAAASASTIVVENAWSRPASDTAVVYATIRTIDGRADRLLGGSTPDARAVELHESMETSLPADSMNGMPMPRHMVGMKALDAIDVPAHAPRVLAPGGYHLMLVRLRRATRGGDRIPLRLRFARAGTIAVVVRVRAF